MKKVRKGFTLVELLIVIVVIGILTAMMMISSTEAVTSAKASNVATNLRNLKTAALGFYIDNLAEFSLNPTASLEDESKDKIFEYLDNGASIPESDDYSFKNFSGAWFVYYDVQTNHNSATEQNQIFKKLKGRAQFLGLLYADANSAAPEGQKLEEYTGDTTKKYVVLKIR